MLEGTSRVNGGSLQEATAVAASSGLSQDTFSAMVRQMVVQCGALLRQQLEHKAKQQPLLYDPQRTERVMREFEAGSADIEDAIAGRVMSRLTHHTQQEVMRVMQDALSDAAQTLEDPLWNRDEAWRYGGWVQKSEVEMATPVEAEPSIEAEVSEPEAEAQPDLIEEPVIEPEPEIEAAPAVEQEPVETSAAQPVAGEVYEGTVKLRVDATGSFRQVIQFVEALRQKSDFRLLKLVGGFEEGVDIWVGLRAPMAVKDALMEIEGVTEVEPANWLDQNLSEPLINVRLGSVPAVS